MESMRGKNYAKFLNLIRILVDNTTKEEPMTKHDILRLCEDSGLRIDEKTFDIFLQYMENAGIYIERKMVEGVARGPYLYWYEEGWI